MKYLSLLCFFLLCTSCGNTPSVEPSTSSATSPYVATTPTTNITPIEACNILTPEKIATVYAGGKFVVESSNNYPPTPYEALSACRYQMEGVEFKDNYHVDLEVRVKASPKAAKETLASILEMDTEKKAKAIQGLGDEAYYFHYSMAHSGPQIVIVKGNVFYKLMIQSIKSGVMNTVENELITLGKTL